MLSLQVVLANGDLLHTGSAAFVGAPPFARWGGPDLTGLFIGDTGALGIKATATLRLVAVPAEQGFASYGFQCIADMVGAQVGLMRQGLGSECFGIDAFKARQGIRRRPATSWLRACRHSGRSHARARRCCRD